MHPACTYQVYGVFPSCYTSAAPRCSTPPPLLLQSTIVSCAGLHRQHGGRKRGDLAEADEPKAGWCREKPLRCIRQGRGCRPAQQNSASLVGSVSIRAVHQYSQNDPSQVLPAAPAADDGPKKPRGQIIKYTKEFLLAFMDVGLLPGNGPCCCSLVWSNSLCHLPDACRGTTSAQWTCSSRSWRLLCRMK